MRPARRRRSSATGCESSSALRSSFIGRELREESEPAADAVIQALDACLTALEQIDRNANLGLVIQRWCEELVGISAGQCGASIDRSHGREHLILGPLPRPIDG